MKAYKNTNLFDFRQTLLLIAAIIICCLVFGSCKKFLEVDAPANQVVSSAVFEDDKTATSAVTGLYSEMMTGNPTMMFGALTIFPGMSADELTYTGTNTGFFPFPTNTVPADNIPVNAYFWQPAYRFIYQANSILEGLEKTEKLTPALKTQLTGEVLFVRALCNFYLENLFGEVPLVTDTDYRENAVIGRTPLAQINVQILTDLQRAKALLNTTRPTSSLARPNIWAPAALLARVYLYHKDWDNAAKMADSIITKAGFQLETNLDNVFLTTSKEAIWQLASVNTANSAEGVLFIPLSATAKPAYVFTAAQLAAFEAGDKRRTSWITQRTIAGVIYAYPFKFKIRSATARSEFTTPFRLAEQYLIRAESRAMQNDLAGAIADVNTIRQRHGGFTNLLPIPADQQSAVDVIVKERRVELFAEWGHRWFDLQRTGRADAILGAQKASWKTTASRYPIPLTQLQRNSSLTQNAGY